MEVRVICPECGYDGYIYVEPESVSGGFACPICGEGDVCCE